MTPHPTSSSLPHASPDTSPRRTPLRLPTTRQVEISLRFALALTLVGTALWYAHWTLSGGAAGQAPAVTRAQELLLSGAVTTRLETPDLEQVRCSPAGFYLQTRQGSQVPLELNFKGAAQGAPHGSSYTLLGSGEDRLTLTVDHNPFTLVSGTVTVTPEGRRFSAALVDRHSQPLWVSGWVRCPSPSQPRPPSVATRQESRP